MRVSVSNLIWGMRFCFFDAFGERAIERTIPAHGDWTEVCGWNFRGKFYPCDTTTVIEAAQAGKAGSQLKAEYGDVLSHFEIPSLPGAEGTCKSEDFSEDAKAAQAGKGEG